MKSCEVCINMYTKQQQLEYLRKLQQIQKLYVLKDDVHLTYIYRNRKKATHDVHTLQDKIQKEIVQRTLDGDYQNTNDIRQIERQHNLNETVNNIVSETLDKERMRIHRNESKFIDKVVEDHTAQYTKFLTNRLSTEARRIGDKVILIEGQALTNGATPEQARKAVWEYAETHGKARTRNIIKDAIHSQECNISFINAIADEYTYKVWMNGRSKGKTREWHKARNIIPVKLDEPFEIYGPYGRKEAMYPGDLNAGAENVANCRCWLRYTNHVPAMYGQPAPQTKYNIPKTSYLHNRDGTTSSNFNLRQKVQNTANKVSSTISSTTNSIKTKVKDIGKGLRSRFNF